MSQQIVNELLEERSGDRECIRYNLTTGSPGAKQQYHDGTGEGVWGRVIMQQQATHEDDT